jgi:ribosome maturation factor RimP
VADQQVILVVDDEPVTIEYDTIKKARPRVELGTGKSDK